MITRSSLKAAIRGPYAWPGGYPMYAITSDGAALHLSCCRKEYRQIAHSMKHRSRDGWQVEAVDVNYEDAELTCDHCGQLIEAAYEQPQCNGHPAGPGDPMGETVFCDGSCRKAKV